MRVRKSGDVRPHLSAPSATTAVVVVTAMHSTTCHRSRRPICGDERRIRVHVRRWLGGKLDGSLRTVDGRCFSARAVINRRHDVRAPTSCAGSSKVRLRVPPRRMRGRSAAMIPATRGECERGQPDPLSATIVCVFQDFVLRIIVWWCPVRGRSEERQLLRLLPFVVVL